MNKTQQKISAEKIRNQYAKEKHTEFDDLKSLDKKVKRPVKIFAYIFGTVSALIMGSGMSLIMTDIAQILNISNPDFLGLVLGIIGMICAAVNYPIYKSLFNIRRKRYASDIINLSDRIIKEQ